MFKVEKRYVRFGYINIYIFYIAKKGSGSLNERECE